MSRKPKLSRTDRKRRQDLRQKQREDALVQDTVARLGCSVETAQDMINQCDGRADEVDIDLVFAGLAHEVWAGRPGHGEELAQLIEELIAEQKRHAHAMETLAMRFQRIVRGEHEHLPDDVVDPDHVRRTLFTPPEDRPGQVARQIPTESDRR